MTRRYTAQGPHAETEVGSRWRVFRAQLERAKRLRQSILQQAFSPTTGAEHA
jgi:hypothetical protein